MKIIDMHTHTQDILFPNGIADVRPSRGILLRLFEWRRFNTYATQRLRRKLRKRIAHETQCRNALACAEDLQTGMERAGITHSVVLPVEPYGSTAEVLSLAEKDERIIPFASVDPRDPGRVVKLKEFVESGCRGLKLHPIIQDFHPSSPECMEIIEEFSQYRLPVLFHSGQTAYYLPESESESYAEPDNYIKLFAAFPSVKFIMGHMGMFEARATIEIAQVFENVYLDTSFQPIRMLRRAVDKVGGDRLVFGSDWPFAGQRYELANILDLAKGNPWLRERILYKNAEELIGEV